MAVLFGSAGNPKSFYDQGHKSSLDMPAWLRGMGLDAYEYQCGRGVHIGEASAKKLGIAAREHGIRLSIHAPYYITMGTREPELRSKSKIHLLKSMRVAGWMGATRVVFHIGSGGDDRYGAVSRARDLLAETLEDAAGEGLGHIMVCPETMGKASQLGNLEEVIAFSEMSSQVIPAIDFGHLHAVSGGGLRTIEDYGRILDEVEGRLGKDILNCLHVHFSPIEYTKAGERRHRTTLDSGFGPDFSPLAQLLAERRIKATVICESDGRQAEDALVYKGLYEDALLKAGKK